MNPDNQLVVVDFESRYCNNRRLKEETMILRKGEKYNNVDELIEDLFVGWTRGDGSGHNGYNVYYYFDDDGCYLGPDEYGIEPIFAD